MTKPIQGKSSISRAIAKLLTAKRPLGYAEIARKVREKNPEAHTTARSVASVASGLRAAGINLPDRRRQTAQPKEAEEQSPTQ